MALVVALVVPHRIPEIRETFYAVTPTRQCPNPLVGEPITAMKKRGVKVKKKTNKRASG